jgi:mRNA interferase RelE/StbE
MLLAMYSIEYTAEARKTLRKLPVNVSMLLVQKIIQLSVSPNELANNIKALNGVDAFRLRVGDYRVIYTKLNDKMIINVIKIGHRKEVYKWN